MEEAVVSTTVETTVFSKMCMVSRRKRNNIRLCYTVPIALLFPTFRHCKVFFTERVYIQKRKVLLQAAGPIGGQKYVHYSGTGYMQTRDILPNRQIFPYEGSLYLKRSGNFVASVDCVTMLEYDQSGMIRQC